MSRDSNFWRVTLVDVASESGWSVENSLQHLGIKPEPDWAGRPSVTAADAARIFHRSTTERDAWMTENDQQQAAQLAAEHQGRYGAPPGESPKPFFRRSRKILGPAGGVAETENPGWK